MKTSWTIYFLALCFGLYETSYFGWNWTPGSPSELICDGITLVLFALAIRRSPEKPNAELSRRQPAKRDDGRT